MSQRNLPEMKSLNAEATETCRVRPSASVDLPACKGIVDANELFPSEMLDDMMAPYLAGHADSEFWLTAEDPSPIALAYCAQERMTQGTWNLLLIAVHPGCQRRGYGAVILREVECELLRRGGRLLLVETSGLPGFERAQSFYRKNGFVEEATIHDFYNSGEDKIVFRKTIHP